MRSGIPVRLHATHMTCCRLAKKPIAVAVVCVTLISSKAAFFASFQPSNCKLVRLRSLSYIQSSSCFSILMDSTLIQSDCLTGTTNAHVFMIAAYYTAALPQASAWLPYTSTSRLVMHAYCYKQRPDILAASMECVHVTAAQPSWAD